MKFQETIAETENIHQGEIISFDTFCVENSVDTLRHIIATGGRDKCICLTEVVLTVDSNGGGAVTVKKMSLVQRLTDLHTSTVTGLLFRFRNNNNRLELFSCGLDGQVFCLTLLGEKVMTCISETSLHLLFCNSLTGVTRCN